MNYLSVHIKGVPYCRYKTKGDTTGPKRWTEAIVAQTKSLPKVSEACVLRVTFLLPEDKFPKDFPYGPDLDNLLKRLLDGLGRTVFSETAGGDSCIISLSAMKTRVASEEKAGALVEILPVSV